MAADGYLAYKSEKCFSTTFALLYNCFENENAYWYLRLVVETRLELKLCICCHMLQSKLLLRSVLARAHYP